MPKTTPGSGKNSRPEQLGRMLVNIYESGYLDKNKTYKMSFIKGAVGGLGGVIGATIGVLLLLWILTLIGKVPFVGPIAEKVETTIEESQRQ